mgnify:CR=1 FL=1
MGQIPQRQAEGQEVTLGAAGLAAQNGIARAWAPDLGRVLKERPCPRLNRTPFCVRSGMKRRDLIKRLSDLGWSFLRAGGSHDIWAIGEHRLAVPRHREINERTAKSIIRQAEQGEP